jgi:hypothetical protein
MDGTPVSEKRQLRQRNLPAPSPLPEQVDSDEEVRGRRKRRKTASRSVQKKNKPAEAEPELTTINGDNGESEITDTFLQPKKGGKGKTSSAKKTPKVVSTPKANGKSTKAGGKKKKQTRSVVKGDTGGAGMYEDDEVALLDEEEDDNMQEEEAMDPHKRVTKKINSQTSKDAPDAELVGDPFDDAEAKNRWPHRYVSKVYLLLFLSF